MKKLPVIPLLVILALYAFFIFFISTHKIAIFDPQGVISHAQRNLILTYVSLMLIIVIPVFVCLIIITWKYRSQNQKANYSPNWALSKHQQIIFWAIPTLMVMTLAIIT